MTKRRSRGDGGLHWDENRKRWIASATVGYSPSGKRIVRKASAQTKTEAMKKLKEIIRDFDDGLSATAPLNYTVANAVRDWLTYGLNGRSEETVSKLTTLANTHVIPGLGARKLRELSADEVDVWLADKAKTLATRTLRELLSILRRAVSRAQARDKVKRNVVLLCDVPTGQEGRPSKSLTLVQAKAVLGACQGTWIGRYIVLSLLSGARTEELRALTWSLVDLEGDPDANPPVLPHIDVWRSVRVGGDTKTRKSRRSLALPSRCVDVLRVQRAWQGVQRIMAGERWQENDLVFASRVGTPMSAHNVRRAFRRIVKAAGLDAKQWTPRELRHSFVSVLSDSGMSIEEISRLVGHTGTTVTELVYRHQIRPVVEHGAKAMDEIFPGIDGDHDEKNGAA